jgi:undecaprenyl-diphosphatase
MRLTHHCNATPGGFTGYMRFLDMARNPHVPQPTLPETIDRRVYRVIHGLPHSPVGDRYVAIVSDVGEGIGWVAAGAAMAWMGGRKGRRAGLAAILASLGTTYLVQRMVKPVFRRKRPFVDRDDVVVVGIRSLDASFPSGHTASSFAAATAIATFYPSSAPLVFALATGVGISRIHLGHHFPSDVAVGATIGLGTGSLVAWLCKKPNGG